MNNAIMLLLAVTAVPAGYVVISEVKTQSSSIRELTVEELAQPPIQLKELQAQPDAAKLPKGIEFDQ